MDLNPKWEWPKQEKERFLICFSKVLKVVPFCAGVPDEGMNDLDFPLSV